MLFFSFDLFLSIFIIIFKSLKNIFFPISLVSIRPLASHDSILFESFFLKNYESFFFLLGLKNKKNIFISFVHLLYYFLGKVNILKNHITFAHLIKGTVLGRALWGANTFPTLNRLPDPKYGFFANLALFLWFSIISYNNYGGDSKNSGFANLIFDSSFRRDFGCDSILNNFEIVSIYYPKYMILYINVRMCIQAN